MKPPPPHRSRLVYPRQSALGVRRPETTARHGTAFLLALLASACSVDSKGLGTGGGALDGGAPTGSGGGPNSGSGGGPAMGTGGRATGGVVGSGGAATGGAPASGGATGTGGDPATGTGGRDGSGGSPRTGGSTGSGGLFAGSGGAFTTGGAPGTGGMQPGTGGRGTGGAGTGGAPPPACNATTCPNGCCMGAMCFTTNRTNMRCGSGGAECKACGACFECSNAGACTPDTAARWDLVCVSASIASSHEGDPWDSSLLPATSLPDPYCELTIDGDTRGTTNIKNDTLTPMWNESFTGDATLTTSTLTASSPRWSIYVYDYDGGSDHAICSVSERFTAAELTAGTVTFTNEDDCHSLTVKTVCAEN